MGVEREASREDPRSPGAAFAVQVTWAQWRPLALVLAVMALGLPLVLVNFRLGALVLGGAATLAFFLRFFLTDEGAGILAVRAKYIDLIVLAGLSLGLLVLAVWVPPQ